jgi:HSP20 family molecular chaperone IbpA
MSIKQELLEHFNFENKRKGGLTMSTKLAPEAQPEAVPVKVNVGGVESLFDRAKEIYGLIARRAYELFEGRGRQDGFDLEDWLRAERESLLPISTVTSEYEDLLAVCVEVPGFNEKQIQVCLEPRRLIISGKIEQTDEQKSGETIYTSLRSNEFFNTLDLFEEVDPAKATATFKDGVLDIRLPKVAQAEPAQVEVKVK